MLINVPFSSDTFIASDSPTVNYSTDVTIICGGIRGLGGYYYNGIIIPNFSTLSASFIINTMSLYFPRVSDFGDNVRTLRVYRILRSVIITECTWNVYSAGNNWGTAGCGNSATDYDGAVEIGSVSCEQPPQEPMEIILDPLEMQKFLTGTYPNYGLLLKMDTQDNDSIAPASLEAAYTPNRPYAIIDFSERGWFFAKHKNKRTNTRLYPR